jgi:hypothetical protein
MNHLKVLLVVAALLSFPAAGQSESTQKDSDISYYQRSEASYAVYGFLRAMDSGNYASLWKKTAPIAQRGLTEGSWASTLANMRKTFGSYKNRNEERHGFSKQMSSGEKGTFYAVVFQSQFSTLTAEEKVIVSHEGGEWKLAGYFLKTYSTK